MVKEENAILPAQELRSLPPELTLSAKLLAARNDRKRGVQYLTAEQVLSCLDHAIARGSLLLELSLVWKEAIPFKHLGHLTRKKRIAAAWQHIAKDVQTCKKSVRPFLF